MLGSCSTPMALPDARGGSLSKPLNLGSGGFEVSREEVKVANTQLEAMLAELLEVSGMMMLAN